MTRSSRSHGLAAVFGWVLLCGTMVMPSPPIFGAPFKRGDINDDGAVGVSDAISLLASLFTFGKPPTCWDAADANDDGSLDISDPVKVLVYLFGGGASLPPPSADCGDDATEDEIECLSYTHCDVTPRAVLSAWLEDRPGVRQAMIWWEPGRGWMAYDAWSEGLKEEFHGAFESAWLGTAEPLDPVPPNLLTIGDLQWPATDISADAAKALYISLAIQSLLAEVKGLIPWTMDAYGSVHLALLFDGRTLLRREPLCFQGSSATPFPPEQPVPANCQTVGFQVDGGWSLPSPGPLAFEFLSDDVGIGPSSLETIGNLLEWARRNMLHFGGSFRGDVAEYYWGYRGAPPAVRIMEGTDPPGFHPQSEEWGWPPENGYPAAFAHWTGGCHGTMALFRAVLRAVNIPVEYAYASGHALPHFLSDDVYMSHGDDPYNLMAKADYPARLLLIDRATHQAWFGNPDLARANVGRQVKVLAAIYLPTALLKNRCDDLAKGLPPESGSVYKALQPAYTLDDLAAMVFWESIDAAIAERGGCGAIH